TGDGSVVECDQGNFGEGDVRPALRRGRQFRPTLVVVMRFRCRARSRACRSGCRLLRRRGTAYPPPLCRPVALSRRGGRPVAAAPQSERALLPQRAGLAIRKLVALAEADFGRSPFAFPAHGAPCFWGKHWVTLPLSATGGGATTFLSRSLKSEFCVRS